MDESKADLARRRRVAAGPMLESLEGRRLMSAAPAQVGIKEVAKSGYTELNINGTNKGDKITIDDNGTNSPGNVVVTLGNGTTYTSKGAISVIMLQDGSGADNVTFNLTGTLTAPQSVLISLGSGNDHFTGNIAGAVETTNGLDLEVYGGSGDDSLILNQTGPTLAGAFVPYLEGDAGHNTLVYNGTGTIATGASVTPEFSGNGGTNLIRSNYAGQINGNYIYNLSVNGGTGNNTIVDDVNVAAGSTGTVGTSSATPAAVEAGTGHDKIRFAVTVDPNAPLAQVYAVAMGGPKAQVTRTANVQAGPSDKNDVVIA